jgi:hypothetical protein
MSHPDEGTIQMLLDGELDPRERARVEDHIAACASCAAQLAEAREFLHEADRLVEVLAVPPRTAQPRISAHRRPLVRTLAWAASIVIAVGIGYWGRGANPAAPTPAVRQESGTVASRANAAPETPGPADEPATVGAAKTAATPTAAGAPAQSDADADKRTREANPTDLPSANAIERKEVATPPPSATAPERSAQMARPAALAEASARLADEQASTWRVISMEDAVGVLGGQIRLIDGLTPDRLETGPGTAVAGADPVLPLVRIVYASGAVILDQQRPLIPATGGRQRDAATAVGGVAAEPSPTAWQQQGGIRFVVTGTVPADSLRLLGERVR